MPISHSAETVSLLGLAKAFGLDSDGPGSAHGLAWQRLPVSMVSYNIPALRSVYNIFASMPSQFHGSFVIFEAYNMHGVQAVPADSTAFPDRENNLLTAPMINYLPGSASDEAEAEAQRYGTLIRDALAKGAGRSLSAYVNYALGDESVEELYGHEPWRVEKLRKLKTAYDPNKRFSFYNPIY